MSLKFTAAMIAAKLARSALRLLGRDGSCTPGRIALKICPDFMAGLKLPEKVLCVTGTNGKTTTSNLAAGMLRSMGYSVTNNSAGSNIQAGVATALLADSTLSGRAKKQIAVLEVDERSSLLVYKYITPDILLCNNLMRDSLKRNAHTDFISYILNTALPSSTRVILNADDFICSSLFPDNTDRTYFGVSAEIPERSATPRDIVYCPDCGGRLTADYLRYDHIGRIRCPNCGKASPEPDFCVTSVDREGGSFTITSGGSERSYRLLNGNLVNIYNFCGAVALLTEAGFDPDRITEAFDGQKIVASRFNSTRSGRLNITLQLAKGQNPGACSRSYSYVAARPEKNKCLLIMTDDKNDNHKNSESVCWIYDTDFSALKDPSISQIIFAGKRCRDQRLRALMAGIDRSKILICDDLFEGAALIDTEKYTDIFILNDPYILAEAGKIRDYLVTKGKESSTK